MPNFWKGELGNQLINDNVKRFQKLRNLFIPGGSRHSEVDTIIYSIQKLVTVQLSCWKVSKILELKQMINHNKPDSDVVH